MTASSEFDGLPAGPFSGAEVTVWRARTGTFLHGNGACTSLSRSTPHPQSRPLGAGATIGELNWPEDLHCPLEFADPVLHRYYSEATAVATLRSQADRALDAFAETGVGHPFYGDERGRWNWPAMAPAMAGALYAPQPAPTDPALAALARQATSRLVTAANQVADEVTPRNLTGWVSDNGRAGQQALYRTCAAWRAYGDYDGRDPRAALPGIPRCGMAGRDRGAAGGRL